MEKVKSVEVFEEKVQEVITLEKEDALSFIEALESPVLRNNRELKAAAERYKKLLSNNK